MDTKTKDRLFQDREAKPFEFDESVATVFDDMISRSVPYYHEALKLSVDFALSHLADGDKVIDLGSSTANTLISLYTQSLVDLRLIGIDNSIFMIEQAQKKIRAYDADIELIHGDILEADLSNSKVIISNYTLQFISTNLRAGFIKKIHDNLCDGGVFIFSEKLKSEDTLIDKKMVEIYYEYKKLQGYSTTEIQKKKDALDNVLIPFTYEHNYDLLKNAGFKSVDTIFRWNNFTTIIAKK
jgi:tRNA (cmo5U34)-methyltransferase